ncbi:glucan 1,4-alpha-glucosidase [Haloarchaeobius sp. HRN-SO-5]|uniref:glucan 1,4-alpha-glucosidase n=1 Tax=Haloarchaeobius sp. HRN-SO-5 TaxID=3446118 RepID=UPI003EBF9DD7
MHLRAALNDYKRDRGRPSCFPGERRTTDGLFSGAGGRLVYVGRDGRLEDFSAPFSGLGGLARARFGVRVDGETRWLDGFGQRRQRYDGHTALVESTFRDGPVTVERTDLTVDAGHVTHVDVSGPADALVVYCSFEPEGAETQVGHLVHRDRSVVEAYHRREHDFLASATGFESVEGRRPEGFAELLADEAVDLPRPVEDDAYEAGRLGGNVLVVVPLEAGEATVATLLEADPVSRDEAVERARSLAADHDPARLAGVANEQFTPAPSESVAADLRVLGLLGSPDGPRIAGPDFDPNYAYSGGYGYTWFRDDAEIARYLLDADAELGLGLDDRHRRSARFYRETQLADGSWPHRVWPSDGSLAPGWANATVEGEGREYQADQTASVVSFLAEYRRRCDPDDAEAVEAAIADGVDALDDWLDDDGLPAPCQNAWEDMTGRFTHTAATYLHAYASVARAPVGSVADHAAGRARTVFDALDALWSHDREAYGLRLDDGELDDRLDSSTFALVEAHRAAAAGGLVTEERLDRLVSHTGCALDGLARQTDDVYGLVRYEGDDWRTRTQTEPKVWTVATAWGAHAAAELARLLDDQGRDGADRFEARAAELLAELLPGGSLCSAGHYLPEQVFDDGTPDSATPLGWPHAIRLVTVARDESQSLTGATVVSEDD